ncbi:MAG TPA: hypothetical protein VK508_15740 [Cyclobacteriaceae bacterium]|nr:hypothetical protein [Cyclobacteriaceae bacterium]
MGSSGSGHLSDYSGTPATGSGNSKTGGNSNEDQCDKAFSTGLEDVQKCSYFAKNKNVPAAKTSVTVQFQDPRFVVVTGDDLVLGYLPTKFNYIAVCFKKKFKFSGSVTSSHLKPVPSITVAINPVK